jgi:hypothetical protein
VSIKLQQHQSELDLIQTPVTILFALMKSLKKEYTSAKLLSLATFLELQELEQPKVIHGERYGLTVGSPLMKLTAP